MILSSSGRNVTPDDKSSLEDFHNLFIHFSHTISSPADGAADGDDVGGDVFEGGQVAFSEASGDGEEEPGGVGCVAPGLELLWRNVVEEAAVLFGEGIDEKAAAAGLGGGGNERVGFWRSGGGIGVEDGDPGEFPGCGSVETFAEVGPASLPPGLVRTVTEAELGESDAAWE